MTADTPNPEQVDYSYVERPHYGWGHNDALYPAIGKVAVRSGLFDELLREILAEVVGDDVWYMFEGQSSDWLVKMCRDSMEWHNVHYSRWTKEQQEKFLGAFAPAQRLRDLRNYVVHGLWSTWAVGEPDENPAQGRPWGGPDDVPGVLVCARSRQRNASSEMLFTVEDVERLALEFQTMMHEVAEAFYEMERRHNSHLLLPRWIDREENTHEFLRRREEQ